MVGRYRHPCRPALPAAGTSGESFVERRRLFRIDLGAQGALQWGSSLLVLFLSCVDMGGLIGPAFHVELIAGSSDETMPRRLDDDEGMRTSTREEGERRRDLQQSDQGRGDRKLEQVSCIDRWEAGVSVL